VVAGTPFSIIYPEGWIEIILPGTPAQYRAFLADNPDVAPVFEAFTGVDGLSGNAEIERVMRRWSRQRRVVVVDPVDGDNIIVERQKGEWWGGLDDWTASGERVAEATDATVLGDGERRIDGRPAFWHIERSSENDGRTIFGYLEVRMPDDSIVSVSTTLEPGAVSAAKTILAGVGRAPLP
jgi:hypothetical protein